MYVKIIALKTLPAEKAIEGLARAMEGLAIAQSLIIIHGEEAGAKRYADTQSAVRFDGDGDPCVWIDE